MDSIKGTHWIHCIRVTTCKLLTVIHQALDHPSDTLYQSAKSRILSRQSSDKFLVRPRVILLVKVI